MESIPIKEVTIGILIYKSTKWLDYVLEGLERAKNKTPHRVLVVANDPYPNVAADPRVNYIHRNPDPDEWYINRCYRAWNKTVELSETEWVCLMNSDMYVSDGWLDELVRCANEGGNLPTSLLVESGALPSEFAPFVKNFGRTPDGFDREAWKAHAVALAQRGIDKPGSLFMPVLFSKTAWREVGGYPNGNPGGIPGDKVFFKKLRATGKRWKACFGSVVYHVQCGEMWDTSEETQCEGGSSTTD